MKLVEILNRANQGYFEGEADIGGPAEYYDPETGDFNPGGSGDTLAKFVVIELRETFDPNASDEVQIEEAQRVMKRAIMDLSGVYRALRL